MPRSSTICWLLLLLITYVLSKPVQQEQVVLAIDCGSTQPYKSSDGIIYLPDHSFSRSSKVADYTYNQQIGKKALKFTKDQQLYKTERYAEENIQYALPVAAEGTYTLILKFCEMYFTEPNRRVFDIYFGSTPIVVGVDIVKKVGPLAAYDLYIEFEKRQNGEFYYKGQLCHGASDSQAHSLLNVVFRMTGKDIPKVDAIVLLRGGMSESNFDEYEQLVNTWTDPPTYASEDESFQKLENLRETIRSDFDTNIDYQVTGKYGHNCVLSKCYLKMYNQGKFDGILEVLFSWKGLLILLILVIFQLCLFCSEDPQDDVVVIDRKQQKYSSAGGSHPIQNADQNPNNTSGSQATGSVNATATAAAATTGGGVSNSSNSSNKEFKKKK